MEYAPQTFTLPPVEGISSQLLEQHVGLYNAYVKNFNGMTALMAELSKDAEKNALAISELVRRRSFEFGGMRLHELYFTQIEGGASPLEMSGALAGALTSQFGHVDACLAELKQAAMMRGPGWSLLYWDPVAKQFLIGFSGEQHMGHYASLPIVFALDVWEHAYLMDYGTLGKGKYVDAFLKNVNWGVVDKRFATIRG